MTGKMSYKEAKLLAQDPNSCVELVTEKRNISLSFKYANSVMQGIKETLDKGLNLYSSSLEGVMVSYSKVRKCQQHGMIIGTQPFMHFHVLVDFAVFRPKKGSTLVGTVNKISNDHIGLVIHQRFNGSVRRPRDPDLMVTLGQVVLFTVDKVYPQAGLLSIRGNLRPDSFQHGKLKMFHQVDDSFTSRINQLGILEDTDTVDGANADASSLAKHSPKKEKTPKQRKRKRSPSPESTAGAIGSPSVSSSTDFGPPGKPKKKKHKKSKDSALNSTLNDSRLSAADMSANASSVFDASDSGISDAASSSFDASNKPKKHKKIKLDPDNPNVSREEYSTKKHKKSRQLKEALNHSCSSNSQNESMNILSDSSFKTPSKKHIVKDTKTSTPCGSESKKKHKAKKRSIDS